MGKLNAFIFITLNGYYKGMEGDINWHKHGAEEGEYSAKSLQSDNILLFGRRTYEMMASFWPEPVAAESFPEVAAGMNKAEKIVFSNTLETAGWRNTRVVSGNITDEIRMLKQTSEKGLTILGSGSIMTQFAEAGLIDEFQIMIDPVAIGKGTPVFEKLKIQLDLKLTDIRRFKSDVILLTYIPQNKLN